MSSTRRRRRSLAYIRLAAYLAGQARDVSRLELGLEEIEEVVGGPLPQSARFPSWWRNSERRSHSRAWLVAGWQVVGVSAETRRVTFERRPEPSTIVLQ